MGTPMNYTESVNGNSTLRTIVELPDSNDMVTPFREQFLELVNITGAGSRQDIQFTASYTCRDDTTNNVNTSNPISYSRNLTGGEHTARATKWVIVNKDICGSDRDHAVLVEVLLWRD